MVMRGSRYKAQIVLASIDSTQRPAVYVNGSRLSSRDGTYEVGDKLEFDIAYLIKNASWTQFPNNYNPWLGYPTFTYDFGSALNLSGMPGRHSGMLSGRKLR